MFAFGALKLKRNGADLRVSKGEIRLKSRRGVRHISIYLYMTDA